MYYASRPAASANEPTSGISLWHRTRPAAQDQRTSHLFWLMVLSLGCLSLVCVTWGASAALAKKEVGKSLQAALLLPKLNSSHRDWKAHPFRLSEPHPSEQAQPRDRKTTEVPSNLPVVVEQSRGMDLNFSDPQLATQEPPHVAPELLLQGISKVDGLPQALVSDVCDDPIVYLQPCTPHRGDSPMIRNWKTLTLYSMLSAATVVYVPQPLLAGDAKKDVVIEELSTRIQELTRRLTMLENKKLPTLDQDALTGVIKEEFKKIENGALADLTRKVQGVGDDVQKVSKSVDTLKSELDLVKDTQLKQTLELKTHKILIDHLAEDLAQLHKKIRVADSSPTASPLPAVDKTNLDEIRSRLNIIQETLARLSPTEKRQSMFMPNNGTTTTSAGRVMLVNLYSDDLLFIINGVGHHVQARSSKMLDSIPVGSLRYEVFSSRFGVLDNKTTNLSSGETFTLTASR